MRKRSTIVAAVVLGLALGGTTFGGSITLDTDLLTNLVGGTPISLSDLHVSDVSDTVIQSEIYSRAYTGPNNLVVYLYQLNNTGTVAAGAHSLERLTLAPVKGASELYSVGYLSSLDDTDGFLADGVEPEPTGFITDDTLLPEVSFSFRKWRGYQINPGEHTKVLYVTTPILYEDPYMIQANVIDGIVASGEVLGPDVDGRVPEPGALLLLLSAVGLAFSGRFRR